MIELTKINNVKITVNADIIELVEETPDTVVTLTTGKKIIVKESRQEVTNLVKSYNKEIYSDLLSNGLEKD
ncbi:MAG: flagellar FlbD family protein [Lachnospiraceae bacterium]|nr:flagellar FlbD family protein [Lachnospiraceae bacterium]MEE1342113.1 flagellar FlbD family protein [Lachnospiraceae bacterium]